MVLKMVGLMAASMVELLEEQLVDKRAVDWVEQKVALLVGTLDPSKVVL